MAASQETTTLEAFAEQNGYFPATVEAVSEHPNGWVLETIDNEHESDIFTFFDETPAMRREEYESEVL